MPTREEHIAKLVWLEDIAGHLGAIDSLWIATHREGLPALPSIIAVGGKPADYTDEELEKLAAFADKVMPSYDQTWVFRRHEDIMIFGKIDGPEPRWIRKVITWYEGDLTSPSLDAAISVMNGVFGTTVAAPDGWE